MSELRLSLTGEQRYAQAMRKTQLQAMRNQREWMANRLGFLPEWPTRQNIIAEFDRVVAALAEADRKAADAIRELER